jgi:hypothetical protein
MGRRKRTLIPCSLCMQIQIVSGSRLCAGDYVVGEVCFAQVKGFPFWPAKVETTDLEKRTVEVIFFGTGERYDKPSPGIRIVKSFYASRINCARHWHTNAQYNLFPEPNAKSRMLYWTTVRIGYVPAILQCIRTCVSPGYVATSVCYTYCQQEAFGQKKLKGAYLQALAEADTAYETAPRHPEVWIACVMVALATCWYGNP